MLWCGPTAGAASVMSCLVKAKAQPFVTIHDYITTVQPWIMGLENDIRRARGVVMRTPVAQNLDLSVITRIPSPLMVHHEASFVAKAYRVQAQNAIQYRNNIRSYP